jgi:hypothetical protein
MTPARDAPRIWLRLEGLAVLLAATLAYRLYTPESWLLFVGLFLLPDLSMLGYLAGPRVGAVLYNLVHTYVGPAILGALGVLWLGDRALAVALVWAAHIGLDRGLGYGLKYSTAFQETHLGRIGKPHFAPLG